MFGWFKRQAPPPAPPRKKSRSSSSRSATRSADVGDSAPAPIPQVVAEGNSQSDWSEWESSMMELDSQIGELPASSQVYERDAESRYSRPAPLVEDTDLFGRVTKNRDV